MDMTVHSRISASAETVGSIDDLLVAILLWLPVKSLVRFMSVSKRWKSLITSACFAIQYNAGPRPAVGIFLCGHRNTAFEYIHLDVQKPSQPQFIGFPDEPYPFWIHHAYKGLILCCSSGYFDLDCRRTRSPIRACCVYNPTLNLFIKLPRPGVTLGVPRFVLGVTLAFNPSKPPYKVVCVRGSEFAPDLCQIEIYSTDAGEWSLAGKPFRAEVNFSDGVYWNGLVHWLHKEAYKVLFFDVDNVKFGQMLLPDVPDGHGAVKKICYFGESCDKLHLVISYDTGVKMIVYEMERDQPGWSAKHCVDLKQLVAAFPGMVSVNNFTRYISYDFTIYYLVQGENETAYLVTKILSKVILFNLKCNTFEEIHEFDGCMNKYFYPSRAFEYIQSLSMFRSSASC